MADSVFSRNNVYLITLAVVDRNRATQRLDVIHRARVAADPSHHDHLALSSKLGGQSNAESTGPDD